jgi:hypothetical protein
MVSELIQAAAADEVSTNVENPLLLPASNTGHNQSQDPTE